ncbi:hypothetical protein [Candidatus Deferrimicrobium sp.]|uniref:hypothetical protein n=1 Tax=Candidatus Deferrimicrobium sp. TaxID=3060586 RepID=UPI002ED8D737
MGRTNLIFRAAGRLVLAAGMLLVAAGSAVAGWEAGTKLGFDSNVGRSIRGGKSDGYLLAYAGFSRGPSGESRGDWVFSAVAEGAAFASVTDLDSAAITISPGLVYFPRAGWTITVAPILQAKTVKDTDQSAVAFGGKLELRERLGEKAWLAEHYAYRDSRATSDIFSYKEHAVGALLGVNWTPAVSSEFGYEFSRGDSFLSVGTSTATSGGTGGSGGGMMAGMFSSAFGSDVVKERVDRHAIGATIGYEWTRSIFSVAGYTLTVLRGDVGSSISNAGFAGVGYRF